MHFGYSNIMVLSVRTNLIGHGILTDLIGHGIHVESTQKTVFQLWAHLKFQPQLSKRRSWLRGLSEISTCLINLQPGDKVRY